MCNACIIRRMDVLEGRMKPGELVKELTDSVAIYPLSQKARIDELLLLDQVRSLVFSKRNVTTAHHNI